MVIDINKKLKEKEIAQESKKLIEKMSVQELEHVNPETGMVRIPGELLAELVFLAVDVAMHFNEEL